MQGTAQVDLTLPLHAKAPLYVSSRDEYLKLQTRPNTSFCCSLLGIVLKYSAYPTMQDAVYYFSLFHLEYCVPEKLNGSSAAVLDRPCFNSYESPLKLCLFERLLVASEGR
jgi:hypothetical protein